MVPSCCTPSLFVANDFSNGTWKDRTVDGSEKSGDHQLILVFFVHYLQGFFIHPNGGFSRRISEPSTV